jgi:hypothetical protein
MRAARASAGLLIVLAASSTIACGAQCDKDPNEPPVVFKDGTTDQAAHVYMSSPNVRDPFAGPWLDFPPGRTYRFPHHLGGVPRDEVVWFAFSPNPTSWVTAAGNQATFERGPPDSVDLRNDTCSDVFIMVKLADPSIVARDAGSGDATTD